MENEHQTEALTNQQKYENYHEQCKRLNRALASGFNLEALFIEYALMEDRTESVLKHAGMWDAYIKSRKGRNGNIDSKLRYIMKLAENKSCLLHKFFADDLLQQILDWKDERNRLIHALLKQEFAHNEITNLAVRGKELSDKLKSQAGKYNRAADKKQMKEDKENEY